MKRLLFKISVFSVSITAVFSLYAYSFIGGEDDNFYRRFTTPPSKSLIVPNCGVVSVCTGHCSY